MSICLRGSVRHRATCSRIVVSFLYSLLAFQHVPDGREHQHCFLVALGISPLTQVGSEFVQKYLGEGPRMVRDVFRLARENSPSVVFIDEIDAIATKRFDAQTGADREVQRILLELLNQMDGFDQSTNVKVCLLCAW